MLLQGIAALGLLIAALQGKAANLIINGDFEDSQAAFAGASSSNNGAGNFATFHDTIGPILGGSWHQDALGSYGWGSVLVLGNSYSTPGVQIPPGPSSGQQWLYLTNGGGFGSKVSQDINLPVGSVDLSFDLSGWSIGPSGGGARAPTVLVELKSASNSVLSQTFIGTTLVWTEFSRTVAIPAAGTYSLSFLVVGPSDNNYPTLDDVRLIAAVPEPQAYAMMLVGLGILGSAARRRR